MGSLRTGCAWALAALASLTTTRVAAEIRPPLLYTAPASCPAQTDFIAALASRGEQLPSPESTPGADELALTVSIEEEAGAYRGSFQTSRGEQASTARDVHGATCAEVFDALAVMSAIALRADREPQPAASMPSSAATPSAPVAAPSSDKSERLRTHGDVFGSPFEARKEVPVEAGTLTFHRARALSLYGGGALGLLPDAVVPRYELSLSLANFTTTPDGTSYLVAPIIRSRISMFGPATYDSTAASSKVFGLSAAVGTCWSPLYDTRGFVALFCGDLGFGVMQVNTNDLLGTRLQRKTQGFGSLGFGFEGEYNLGSLFHLGLKAGLDLLTSPVTAERANGAEIFHSASFGSSSTFSGYGVAGYAELGFGIHF
jgi:hypothetical protein